MVEENEPKYAFKWSEENKINNILVGVSSYTPIGLFTIGWRRDEASPSQYLAVPTNHLGANSAFATFKEAEAYLVEFYIKLISDLNASVEKPHPAQPQPTPPTVPQLQWSEERKPDEKCCYDHVFADTPIGRITIEWKSWKKYDSYDIQCYGFDDALWGFDSAYALEDAKQKAQEKYNGLVYRMLGVSENVTSIKIKNSGISGAFIADNTTHADLTTSCRNADPIKQAKQDQRDADLEFIYSQAPTDCKGCRSHSAARLG
jgi:hypothetical protein